jgi:hypothetical protein
LEIDEGGFQELKSLGKIKLLCNGKVYVLAVNKTNE